MAIDFKLMPRGSVPVSDSDFMGRAWAGWDDSATLEQIWEVNRGQWVISADRLAQERYATMSYDGFIRLVAEIDEFETIPGDYKVLSGRVLPSDHPMSEALVGTPWDGHRNPVSYIDTDRLERDLSPSGSGHTVLLTYNPSRFDFYATQVPESQARIAAGEPVTGQWSVGRFTRGIGPGDSFYLLQQGSWGRGLVASGVVTSEVFQDVHFDEAETKQANYVEVSWTTILDEDALLPLDQLKSAFPSQDWQPRGSGQRVRPEVARELALMWAQHVGSAIARGESPGAAGEGGQGRQADTKLRKQIEDAAQDRLMQHYMAMGWQVEDCRYAGPYDAIAVKGDEVLYLEAKGTTTAGDSVLVTRNEVAHARAHAGSCILGILSSIQLDQNGDVDPSTGEFWVGPFDPGVGELEPVSYQFSPEWDGFEAH